jgi:Na+-translocating ferredoxin:NAD+ oxidoreductase RNF subunit RnfB
MANKGDIPAAQIRILDEMLKRPENRECADCGTKGCFPFANLSPL